jgi:dolichyl-phosphate beta-glucosyltransferase
MRYSVVIPALNEAKIIASTLEQVLAAFDARKLSVEVIVSEDGSKDATVRVVEEFSRREARVQILSGKKNRGKGSAVRRGVMHSKGELVLLTDADLSTPMSELPRLEDALGRGYSIAIGSRGCAGARLVKRQPLLRECAGKAGNLLIRAICPSLWEYSDTQCGFKLFRGEVARELFNLVTVDRFAFDVEVLYLARKRGFRVAEIPVVWAHHGGSKVTPVDYVTTLMDVVRVRLNDAAGKYDA